MFCTHNTLSSLSKISNEILFKNTLYNLNLKEISTFTYGSVVNRLSFYNQTLADHYYNIIKSEYINCKSKADAVECKLFFFNVFINMKSDRLIKDIFESEIENCKTNYSKLCIACLKTLQKYSKTINENILQYERLIDNLLYIFYTYKNESYSSLIKVEALNVLLDINSIKNDKIVIFNILNNIYDANEIDFEFTLYAHKKIMNSMKSSQSFK